MTTNHRAIYARHPDRYMLIATRDGVGKQGRRALQQTEHLPGTFSAEEAHEEARMLVGDPRDNITEIYVYGEREGQFIGAFYRRGEVYPSWEEQADGRLELPIELTSAALVPGGLEPVREVDAPIDGGLPIEALPGAEPVPDLPADKPADQRAMREGCKPRAAKLPGDRFPAVRGRSLCLGLEEGWPKSAPAQVVRAFYDSGAQATAAECVAALGEQLKTLSVAHPAALISRLKQAGLLKEVGDAETTVETAAE